VSTNAQGTAEVAVEADAQSLQHAAGPAATTRCSHAVLNTGRQHPQIANVQIDDGRRQSWLRVGTASGSESCAGPHAPDQLTSACPRGSDPDKNKVYLPKQITRCSLKNSVFVRPSK